MKTYTIEGKDYVSITDLSNEYNQTYLFIYHTFERKKVPYIKLGRNNLYDTTKAIKTMEKVKQYRELQRWLRVVE